jgi:hypothetical protein
LYEYGGVGDYEVSGGVFEVWEMKMEKGKIVEGSDVASEFDNFIVSFESCSYSGCGDALPLLLVNISLSPGDVGMPTSSSGSK